MTNDECRMMKEIRMTNAENVGEHVFVLRASSLFSSSSHARHVWKAQEPAQNFLALRILDLSDTNGVGNIEASGFYAPQRL
jgi:hypothetical protein